MGMLSTGVSGLLAFQSSLDTTSHNIANANTAGYSRQSTDLVTATPAFLNNNWVGNGVTVQSIQRNYDSLVAAQVRTSSAGKSQWDIYSQLAGTLNNLFSDSSSGVSASLQNFFTAFQSVANSPTSSSERQVLLSQAQTLVTRLNTTASRITSMQNDVNQQLGNEAQVVTGLAQSIAQINEQISFSIGKTGNPPNDLYDRRDQLLDQLASHLDINAVKQSDGTISVFIGNGQALVSGTDYSQLVTTPDSFDATRLRMGLKTGAVVNDISDSLNGGTVGGLLKFRSELLDTSMNALGQVAVAVTTTVNAQQNAGMDLTGALGSNLFAVGGVQVLSNSSNAGSGAVAVTRTSSNLAGLTTSDYILTRTASGWQLQRTDTGQLVTMTGAGTNVSPFVADGLSIVVSGSAATGDRFGIAPTKMAASGMSVLLNDPKKIAAAAPIVGAASTSNTGNAIITKGVVVDATNANLRNTVTIQFLSPTTYTTDGGTTTNTYTSGSSITVNGWQVQISGTPATGDTFTVKDNVNGVGDNRNALLLANVINNKVLNGSTTTISTAVGSWVADVGVKTNAATANLNTQSALYNDSINAQQSVSGVNLDEEAANLLRFQQAYAAAAKVISTSNALFDSLLRAVGG